jgi:hypothetical protein
VEFVIIQGERTTSQSSGQAKTAQSTVASVTIRRQDSATPLFTIEHMVPRWGAKLVILMCY